MHEELFYGIRVRGQYVTNYATPGDYDLGVRRKASWLTISEVIDWLKYYHNLVEFADGGFTVICMGKAYRKDSE